MCSPIYHSSAGQGIVRRKVQRYDGVAKLKLVAVFGFDEYASGKSLV